MWFQKVNKNRWIYFNREYKKDLIRTAFPMKWKSTKDNPD